MTDSNLQLSANKQALLKIRELKQLLAEAREFSGEPIAIVSMACRFPRTANTPEKFWQSLIDQDDLVGDIPEDRWDLEAFHDDDPEVPGKMYAKRGVFLDDIDKMDPEFFGISPREATWVDPQQRLLMEVGWEAIERAGWIPEAIGESTGVFVGWMHNDYQNEASDSFLNLNPYIATGAAGSFLCGRLAYYLGLQGPSVAIDTACSSSLVALHLAIQSLQRRDCDRALVGGVNVICSPTTNILTCKLKALSPNGHSRAFDAAADGYLRGEGCGVVTLTRLSDAEKNGDPILGIIRGSAVGHNGFSSGLTAPNPRAQEKVITEALQRAGITPDEVGYLEAHGTGTELGDPIEVNAAAAAYCKNRTGENPLLIGSVKTNIGHLEAAAGMAGLIKVLLAMQHRSIPGQMNFETPNPHIPWDNIPVKVLTEKTAWPNRDRLIAGVSAFGMSGTNAHIVVEAPPERSAPSEVATKPATFISLSGKSEEAVFELAHRYASKLQSNDSLNVEKFAASTNRQRSHFEQRAAVTFENKAEAIENLLALSHGSESDSIFQGNHRSAPRMGWQFTGQGSQYPGMGKQLYETQPVFKEAIEFCEQHLSELRGESLKEVIFNEDDSKIHNTHWTQPAIFALQMGLAKLLSSWNIKPDVVLGHSVGQYAAACVAGVMSWEDGLRLIAERGRLIGELPPGGKMLALFAPANIVKQAIQSVNGISLAALNGTHVVVSGDEAAVERFAKEFSARDIKTKILQTSHAFHSHLMEPALAPFAEIANKIDFAAPKIPLICNVSGKLMPPDQKLDGQYWADHIRSAVNYAPGIEAVNELNCGLLIELGPQGILTRMAAANFGKAKSGLISCLNRNGNDASSLKTFLAQTYAQGATLDFRAIHRNADHQPIDLPTYPFQRRRFWGPDKPRAFHAEYHTAHPLLGSPISLAGAENESRFESFIDNDSPSWMPEHEVMGATVFPGAGFIEMAIQAANGKAIVNAAFEQPIRPTGRTALQTVIRTSAKKEAEGGDKTETESETSTEQLETFASAKDSQNWSRHFGCQFAPIAERPATVDLQQLKNDLAETAEPADFYQKMAAIGLNYGPAFQAINEFRFSESQVLAKLNTQTDVRGYNVPPTLLDAALHSLAVGLLKSDDGNLFLPVGIGRVDCYTAIENEAWCIATWKQNEGQTRTADLKLVSESGDVLMSITDLTVKQVNLAALRQMSGVGAERLVHEITWKPERLGNKKLEPKRWLVVSQQEQNDENSGSAQLADQLSERLVTDQHAITRVQLGHGIEFANNPESGFQLCGQSPENWEKLFENVAGDPDESGKSDGPGFDGVCWLVGSEHEDNTSVLSLLALVQTMLKHNHRKLACGFQIITQNAISIDAQDVKVVPQQTSLWGFGRVLSAEQPELRFRMLDVNSEDIKSDKAIGPLATVTLNETADNQHAIRAGQVLVPRLVRSRLKSKQTFQANPDGCYLITGGLGKLGRQAGRWLAEKNAKQLVFVSRREPDEQTREFLDSINQTGCQSIVHSCDISQRDEVENLFQRFGNDLHPLSGVIHAAGVLDDGLIESQTAERFERVLKPKIVAAKLLDELTRELELDLFVLYSSAASVLGSPGQSNYATGNAFLDGLAFERAASGLPAISVNWGPWTEGMADDPRIIKQLSLQGITPLTVEDAHQALEKMIVGSVRQATVMDVDWKRMRIGASGETAPLLRELVGSRKRLGGAESALVNKLKSLPSAAQRELLVATVQNSLQNILSTPDAPETDRPLIEMGLDSLMAVEFGTELQQMLGDQFNVGPTMLFDHPTIDAISDHVLELIASQTGTGDAAAAKSGQTNANATGESESNSIQREDIAIVGLSCKFPGAENADQFWDNLINGVDSVCDIPTDRWDIDRFYSEQREEGKMYTRQGGFLSDIADFDASFFNISDLEACWIDPQHRMLLENSYRALEDAGIPTSPLADPSVGVFMGIMGSDYAFLPTLDDEDVIKGFQGAGLSHSAGVGRISYLFGFEGPSVAVDTASSSSLVAVYQAMRSLQERNCNLALAGGVNAILAPVNSLLMSKAGLLSPDGRCKSFSQSADGFGRGEGCGVVVLKRLSDAERDGDRIMAVIRGGSVVHNGFSGGITSPSGKAQSRAIDAALKDARIAPSEVQYLEAHGTGTEYGDPMELGAAMKIYGKGRPKDKPLLVGSVKANISHLEAAGGSSGLIKTVLAIAHGTIPQQIHFDEPSPHIPWKRMPIEMVRENRSWPETKRKTAGITALGLVGTNAHLILSEPESELETPQPVQSDDADSNTADETSMARNSLLVLSARCQKSLNALADGYINFLNRNPSVDFADVCYTASSGRNHFEHRIAIVADSATSAAEQLRLRLEASSANLNGAASNGHAENGKPVATRSKKKSPSTCWLIPEVDGHGAVSELNRLKSEFEPVKEFLDTCAARLAESGDSFSEIVNGDSFPLTQQYLLQAGLAQLWQSWGVEPDVVLGTGVGQYVAAATAGCLCFVDALMIVHAREKMLAWPDPDWEAFEKLADQFNFYPPNLPLVCSFTGEMVPIHRSLGGSYWRQHANEEIQLLKSVQATGSVAHELNVVLGLPGSQGAFQELDEIDSNSLIECIESSETTARDVLVALGRLYQSSCKICLDSVGRSTGGRRRLSLPKYPFQKKRYWITEISQFMKPEVEAKETVQP